jgi:excisionase family DNA binding protein
VTPTTTITLMLTIDRDTATHLKVAIRRHRALLDQLSAAQPDSLIEIEQLVTSIAEGREASGALTRRCLADDGLDEERPYLTRQDVVRLTGTSRSTVDRWIASGRLSSTLVGRIRRIDRDDLARFLRTTGPGLARSSLTTGD